MKRIILVFVLLFASLAVSHAQYAYPPEVTSRGGKILVEGEKLSPAKAALLFDNVCGVGIGDDYLKYRKGYRTGVGLSVGGAATFVVGLPASYIATAFAIAYGFSTIGGGEVPKGVDIAVYGTYGITLAGAAMMIAGIPTASVYRHRIKKVTAEYNSTVTSSKPVVTFSPARSGFGIAMNF